MKERYIMAFDAPAAIARAVDKHVARLKREAVWARASRSAAIRDLVERGLRQVEQEEKATL